MITPIELLQEYLNGITEVQKGFPSNGDGLEIERQRLIFLTSIRFLETTDLKKLKHQTKADGNVIELKKELRQLKRTFNQYKKRNEDRP